MTELLIATMLFLSVGVAAVFIAGAALCCIGGYLCWTQLQRMQTGATSLDQDLQVPGPYRSGLKEVSHQDDEAQKEFDEWLNNIPVT